MKLKVSGTVLLAIVFLGVIPTGAFDLYDKIPNLDKFLHLAGGLVLAWFLTHLFTKERRALPRVSYFLFILGITALASIGWEFAEHVSGAYSKVIAPIVYHYFRGGNLTDTLLDLVADLGGAFLFLLVALARLKSARAS